MAAVLACGPEAVLSHHTAAQHWGLLSRHDRLPEVTRPRRFRTRFGIHSHRSPLGLDERTVLYGIPVTTVPRTILDVAAIAPRRQLERALNEAEVRGLTDALSIPDLLARYPGRRGSAVLRALLSAGTEASGATGNAFEDGFSALVERHRLPRPRFNADLAIDGRFFSVDCMWPRERLVVELDGRMVHGTRRAFEADRERDRLLIADGWRVIRVTWRQLHAQGPKVAADIRRALSRP